MLTRLRRDAATSIPSDSHVAKVKADLEETALVGFEPKVVCRKQEHVDSSSASAEEGHPLPVIVLRKSFQCTVRGRQQCVRREGWLKTRTRIHRLHKRPCIKTTQVTNEDEPGAIRGLHRKHARKRLHGRGARSRCPCRQRQSTVSFSAIDIQKYQHQQHAPCWIR